MTMAGDSQTTWRTVTEAADDVGDPLASALRVQSWMYLWGDRPGKSSAGRFRSVAGVARRVIGRGGKKLPKAGFHGGITAVVPSPHGASMGNMLPVIVKAASLGVLNGVLACDDAAGKIRLPEGVPLFSYSDLFGFTTAGERAGTVPAAWDLTNTYVRKLKSRCRENGVDSKDVALFELANIAHSAMVLSRGFRRLISELRPSALVSTSDFFPADTMIFREAIACGAWTGVVQHGVEDRFWWPFTAHADLLWGERFKKRMESFGAASERLRICGMPALDAVFNGREEDGDGINERAPVCLVLSNAHARVVEPELYEAFGKILSGAVRLTPGVKWIVKLHPVEDDSFYRTLGGDVYGRLEFLGREVTLKNAVGRCSVAITPSSTAGLEAMAAGKPLLVVEAGAFTSECAWWPAHGGGRYVGGPKETAEIVLELTRDPKALMVQVERQDDFMTSTFANCGRSAEAVVQMLIAKGGAESVLADPLERKVSPEPAH